MVILIQILVLNYVLLQIILPELVVVVLLIGLQMLLRDILEIVHLQTILLHLMVVQYTGWVVRVL